MPKMILVVDAEPVVRDVVSSILQREGYEVKSLEDPKAALEIIKTAPPALVITNVSLPGISGHDAMKLFRRSCPGVPVLMVSGLPDSEVIQHWIEEDGFDAFPKPFSPKELAAKVREVLAADRPD